MMLPRSTYGILYAKHAGALLGWLPGPIIGLIVTFVSPQLRQILGEMVEENGGCLILLSCVLYFALIPHFAGFLSLYVRWGPVALAICLVIVVYFGLVMAVSISSMVLMSLGLATDWSDSQILVFGGVAFLLFSLCAACHIGALLRIQALAAK